MPHYKYGFQGNVEKTGKAQLYNIDASWKELTAVCDSIKGMDVEVATVFLEKVKNLELPVRFRKHSKRMGHRRELGGAKGRYPEKAAGYVLQVLKNAAANAGTKGILNPVIIHSSANSQARYPRIQSKGRRSRGDYETSRVEIVVGEVGSVQEVATKKAKENIAKKIAEKEVKAESKVEKKVEKKVSKKETAIIEEEPEEKWESKV